MPPGSSPRRRWRLLLWPLVLVATLGVLVFLVRLRYGGGVPYPDLTGQPLVPDEELEVVLESPEPVGNVAVAGDGTVYYTVHPGARPEGPRLWAFRGGESRPFPEAGRQEELFQTPLGVAVDGQGRLWVVDPGRHGFGQPRLLAFALDTGRVAYDLSFPRQAAPWGSFLQDLQVAPDGSTVYVADVSFWRRRPALVVVDLATRTARRVLEGHPSVRPQPWLIRTPLRTMTFLGGLVTLQAGVDGLALTRDGEWLLYGAMSHDTLYRVPTVALRDPTVPPRTLAAQVEAVGSKPLSDGLSTDLGGNALVTDVEHGAVVRITPDGALRTLVCTPRIRWADALSYGPEGWLYVADSAIPDLMLRSRGHIHDAAPYFVFRFPPGIDGVPGQ